MACLWLQMESDLEAYRAWYPPVRSSLLCLSKLYGCLDPKIFNGLAQDAVHAATVSVQVSIFWTPSLSRHAWFPHVLSCMRCSLELSGMRGDSVLMSSGSSCVRYRSTRKAVHLFPVAHLERDNMLNCFWYQLACVVCCHSW